MARVTEVLDDLLRLHVTPGPVDVLGGMQCAPCDALGRLHHPLESPVVVEGAIDIQYQAGIQPNRMLSMMRL